MSCAIKIENHRQEYRPETAINGKLTCTFTRRTTVRAITIELVGTEQTGWHKSVNHSIGIPVLCTGSNNFLSIPTTLSEEDTFDEGVYKFPFAFQLPGNIPGTYTSSDLGCIKYYLQAELQQANFVADDMKDINVVSPIDIEDINITYLAPFNEQVEKEFPPPVFLRCLPHAPDRIFTQLYMPRRAITQGEAMNVNVQVFNRSQLDVRNVELIVGQVIEYKVNSLEDNTRTQHETLFYDCRKTGPRRKSGEYNFKVKIPALTKIPNFGECKFISQKFYVKVNTLLRHDEVELYARIMVAQNGRGASLPTASEKNAITALKQELEEAGFSFTPSLRVLRALLAGNEATVTDTTQTIVTSPEPLTDLDAPPPSYESIYGAEFAPSAPVSIPVSMPMPITSFTPRRIVTPRLVGLAKPPIGFSPLHTTGDALYPPPIESVRPPRRKNTPLQADRLYPPPMESIRPPIASMPLPQPLCEREGESSRANSVPTEPISLPVNATPLNRTVDELSSVPINSSMDVLENLSTPLVASSSGTASVEGVSVVSSDLPSREVTILASDVPEDLNSPVEEVIRAPPRKKKVLVRA